MARYVIADPDQGCGWGHIFPGDSSERCVRFVWDREAESLEYVSFKLRRGWSELDRHDEEDLLDSLLNANPEALEDPEGWGLMADDILPDWADPDVAPSP